MTTPSILSSRTAAIASIQSRTISRYTEALSKALAGWRQLFVILGLCLLSLSLPVSADEATPINPIAATVTQAESINKININTASAEEIAAALKGVGLRKAEAIIQYRETNGAFVSIDELQSVKGIGPAIMKKNAAAIALN